MIIIFTKNKPTSTRSHNQNLTQLSSNYSCSVCFPIKKESLKSVGMISSYSSICCTIILYANKTYMILLRMTLSKLDPIKKGLHEKHQFPNKKRIIKSFDPVKSSEVTNIKKNMIEMRIFSYFSSHLLFKECMMYTRVEVMEIFNSLEQITILALNSLHTITFILLIDKQWLHLNISFSILFNIQPIFQCLEIAFAILFDIVKEHTSSSRYYMTSRKSLIRRQMLRQDKYNILRAAIVQI